MSEPVFVDRLPGQQRRNTVNWTEILEPVMARPLTWALVRHFNAQGTASSTADRLKLGAYHIPKGRWEFATRKADESGRTNLYARYLGENGETAS